MSKFGSDPALSRREFTLAAMLGVAAGALRSEPVSAAAPDAAPESDEAYEPASRYGWNWGRPVVASARSQKAMIASSRGGRPLADALAMLEEGANAMDAGLAMAIGQVVHAAGTWVTFAGILNILYFDARTGKLSSMNAGFNTVAGERDPMTIPAVGFTDNDVPRDSGRGVLVPGFMAGVEAAHARHGSVPFERLFSSGIALAEGGMAVTKDFAAMLDKRRPFFARLPATAAIFGKAGGSPFREGELFRQPALAKTLREVAAHGPVHMYRGAWARRFVASVRADGGKLAMDDLAAYRPVWGEPLRSEYRGFDVCSSHDSHFMHGGLRLAKAAGLAAMGRYYENPEVFYWYHKIFRATGTNMSIMGPRIDALPVPPGDWLDDRKVADHWQAIRAGRFPAAPGGAGAQHSDCIVVADAMGNVASIVHSTNGPLTGLYVDGVAVPAPGGRQREHIRKVGRGQPLPNMLPNTIVLKDGKPAIAVAAIGNALHQETIKLLTNVIDYGKAGREAVQAPSFIEPFFSDVTGLEEDEVVLANDYTAELLDGVRALGMPVFEARMGGSGGANASAEAGRQTASLPPAPPRPPSEAGANRDSPNVGAVVALVIDPHTREREGVSARWLGDAQGL